MKGRERKASTAGKRKSVAASKRRQAPGPTKAQLAAMKKYLADCNFKATREELEAIDREFYGE
jgi:hypothetical protein